MSISKAFVAQITDFEKMLLNSRRRITHDLEAVAVVVCEISISKLKSSFDFFLTLSIFISFSVQTPAFEKILLKSRRRLMHGLEAVALVLHELSTRKLNSNLAFILTLSISKAFVVQTPDFEKMLLNSRRRIAHDVEAVPVVVLEISKGKLRSNLAFFLTLSISIPFLVQISNFEKIMLN